MALAVPAIPAGSGAFAVLDVESLLAHLPAETRARVVWAQAPIKAALQRLRTEPLTDELVQSAARQAWPPVLVLTQAFWESFATNREQWRTTLAADVLRDREALERLVDDDDARDTIAWIFGVLRSYYDFVLTAVQPDPIPTVSQEELESVIDDKNFLPLLAGQVALLGAIDAAKANADAERVRDLLDVAFLELNKARAALRRHGLWLTPFPDETQDERGARAIRYAQRVRGVLSEGDIEALEAARLRDLR